MTINIPDLEAKAATPGPWHQDKTVVVETATVIALCAELRACRDVLAKMADRLLEMETALHASWEATHFRCLLENETETERRVRLEQIEFKIGAVRHDYNIGLHALERLKAMGV